MLDTAVIGFGCETFTVTEKKTLATERSEHLSTTAFRYLSATSAVAKTIYLLRKTLCVEHTWSYVKKQEYHSKFERKQRKPFQSYG